MATPTQIDSPTRTTSSAPLSHPPHPQSPHIRMPDLFHNTLRLKKADLPKLQPQAGTALASGQRGGRLHSHKSQHLPHIHLRHNLHLPSNVVLKPLLSARPSRRLLDWSPVSRRKQLPIPAQQATDLPVKASALGSLATPLATLSSQHQGMVSALGPCGKPPLIQSPEMQSKGEPWTLSNFPVAPADLATLGGMA